MGQKVVIPSSLPFFSGDVAKITVYLSVCFLLNLFFDRNIEKVYKPFKVFTATGTFKVFHPEPLSSFFRSFALDERRIFERRLKDSALLSRGLRAKIPMASA